MRRELPLRGERGGVGAAEAAFEVTLEVAVEVDAEVGSLEPRHRDETRRNWVPSFSILSYRVKRCRGGGRVNVCV